MARAAKTFAERLLEWYDHGHRLLPWRVDDPSGRPNPWRILVSEIMLQQTRVEAVIPYFHRFLERFPGPAALADAPEAAALAAWSGLGYYSRVRNLRRAAQAIGSAFPSDYRHIRDLPGVGPYTAAAVASIAFGLPFAVGDGNVFRVLARFQGDAGDIGSQVTRARLTQVAQSLLDPVRPGDFNQALMELGATVCLPRAPRCLLCPLTLDCRARLEDRQSELPVTRPRTPAIQATLDVVLTTRAEAILLTQRSQHERRMAGFWELPLRSALPQAANVQIVGEFAHTIVNTRYSVRVWGGEVLRRPARTRWFPLAELDALPLTTIARKAIVFLYSLRTIAANP